MQSFTSDAYWTCPACDQVNIQGIEVPELNFAAEKMSDMSTHDSTYICCDHCKTEFTGYVWVFADHTDFEIEEPDAFSFTGDMPMYAPPEEYYDPPDDPHSVAVEALGQLSSMVGADSPANDLQFTNRLIFAGAIASFEAFLGDTLVNAVLNDEAIRNRLVQNDRKLGAIKVSAAELSGDSQVLQKRIVAELRNVLYHNLSYVLVLYKNAFDLELIPSEENRDLLFNAVQERHDCVHRNGSNKDGEKLTVFTNEYVQKVIAAINTVIDHVDENLTESAF